MSVRQQIKSHDGPSGQNKVDDRKVDVQVILPSEIMRRELANPNVGKYLDLKWPALDRLSIFSGEISETQFFHANPALTLSPYICFNYFEKAYIGEIVQDEHSQLHLIIDITIENARSNIKLIRSMKAYYASTLPARLQNQALRQMKTSNWSLRLSKVIVIQPKESKAESWDPLAYPLIGRSKLHSKVPLKHWDVHRMDNDSSEPILLFQICSVTGDIELVNVQPVLHNHNRWHPQTRPDV